MQLPDYFINKKRRPKLAHFLRILMWGGASFLFVLLGHFIREENLMGCVFAFLLMFAYVFPGFLLDVYSRKLLEYSAAEILANDSREPILFLRDFSEEGTKLPIGESGFEETMIEVLKTIGPVVAVGRPGETLPEIGAARFYLEDNDWKKGVKYMIDRSKAIVVQASSSAGLEWEIETLLSQVIPEKLIFFFVASQKLENRSFLKWLHRYFPELASILHRRVHFKILIQGQRKKSKSELSGNFT